MRAARLVLLGLVIVAPGLAAAQDATGCAKFKWSIAREQTAFAAPALTALASGDALPVKDAAAVKLQPQPGVAFVRPPARKPRADPAFAAVLTLAPLSSPGTYQVTLSDEAWIDMLQDGKEVRSSGFSGQPDCPGVRKSVRFALKPGPTTVQISGASVDNLKIDVQPVE